MKENIPTPARAGQLGDGKVTKLWWHRAAAPIRGCGYNCTHCTNDSCIQSPRPIRTWTTPSRQCFHVLTAAGDSNSCEVVDGSRRLDPGRDDLPNKVSVSFFSPSHEKHQGVARCNKTHSSFDIDLRPSGNDHPHTCAIHLAIGTSVFIILTIQRCSNISFGVGRVSGSWMRLKHNFRRQPTHNGSPNKGGRGSETYASLMKSFIALLHCTFSSSSSLGGWVGHNKKHGKSTKYQSAMCQNSNVHDEWIITSDAEMYIMSSMAGRSLGNGNRF